MTDAKQRQNLIGTLEAVLTSAEELRVVAKMDDASGILQNAKTLLLADAGYAQLAGRLLATDAQPPEKQTTFSETLPDNQALVRLHACIFSLQALIYSDQDRLDEAEHQIKQSLILSHASGIDDGKAFFVLADIHRKQGKYAQAIAEFISSVSSLKHQSDQRTAAFVLDSLAHAVAAVGNLTQACAHRKEAIDIVEKLGEAIPVAIFQGNLAKDYYRLGDLPLAEEVIHKALAGLKNKDPRCESYSYRILGDILTAQNKIPEAREAYLEAAKSEITHCYAMANVGLGWWEFRIGSPENAVVAFEVARDPQIPQQDEALKTEALAGLAVAQWKLGNNVDALKNINTALQQDITRDNLYVRGFVFAAHATLLKTAGHESESLAASAHSDDAFGMSARPLLGLSDKLFEKLNPRL